MAQRQARQTSVRTFTQKHKRSSILSNSVLAGLSINLQERTGDSGTSQRKKGGRVMESNQHAQRQGHRRKRTPPQLVRESHVGTEHSQEPANRARLAPCTTHAVHKERLLRKKWQSDGKRKTIGRMSGTPAATQHSTHHASSDSQLLLKSKHGTRSLTTPAQSLPFSILVQSSFVSRIIMVVWLSKTCQAFLYITVRSTNHCHSM